MCTTATVSRRPTRMRKMSFLCYCYACNVRVNSVVVGIFERCASGKCWSNARNSQYWKYLFLGVTEHVILQWWQTRWHPSYKLPGRGLITLWRVVSRLRKISPVHIWNCPSKWRVDGSLDKAMTSWYTFMDGIRCRQNTGSVRATWRQSGGRSCSRRGCHFQQTPQPNRCGDMFWCQG